MKALSKVFPVCALSIALTACNLDSGSDNDQTGTPDPQIPGTKQLFVAGGHLVACSSMGQGDCSDWSAYRKSVLKNIADSEIRVPVDQAVSVSNDYVQRVLNTSAWADTPEWQAALSEVLAALQQSAEQESFASWNDFKAAFIDVAEVNSTIDGNTVDGDYLWYSSSSDQWDALHFLKVDDGLIQYTPDADKQAAAVAVFSDQDTLLAQLEQLNLGETYSYIRFINALGDGFNNLDVEQQFRLLRLYRDEVAYQRPLEYVAFDDTNNSDSVRAYQQFVAMAAENLTTETSSEDSAQSRPKILVMTSSSNNNYDVADYYVNLFDQAGADTVWFPVDRAYRQSVDQGNCDDLQLKHDVLAGKAHQDIYFADYAAVKQQACEDPNSILQLIESADGLFINGGSQSRSLESLITELGDSEEMSLIRQRFEAGELVIGGSSAGAAVQAGGRFTSSSPINPMIDGGSSYDVLVEGYPESAYNDQGGLGVFNWGITDTHFSERARETRLIRLAQQQGVRFGFGVDETTALVVKQALDSSRAEMSVIGAGGVYIADLQLAQVSQDQPLVISNVKTHYLVEGDQLSLDNETESYQINFRAEAEVVAVDTKAEALSEDDLFYTSRDNYRQLLNSMMGEGVTTATGTSYEDDPRYQVSFSRQDDTLGMKDSSGKVSYQAVYLDIAPVL